MYNLNTTEGKQNRIKHIAELQSKVACVPGNYLSYEEASTIIRYLGDIASDLEQQVKKEQSYMPT